MPDRTPGARQKLALALSTDLRAVLADVATAITNHGVAHALLLGDHDDDHEAMALDHLDDAGVALRRAYLALAGRPWTDPDE